MRSRFEDPRRRKKRTKRVGAPSKNGGTRTRWAPAESYVPPEQNENLPVEPLESPNTEATAEVQEHPQGADVPDVQPDERDLVIERFESKVASLEREIECHKIASNQWECPPGFIVETKKVGVAIENTGKDKTPQARVHHFVAKHVETEWVSDRYIDKAHAVRRCWERHVEIQLEEITSERDELQRRWEQRKKTEESKANQDKAGEK